MNKTPSTQMLRAHHWAWISLSLFYFYQYFLRVSPGIMIHDLRNSFHMTAEEFSTLGSYYLYAYSLVQIPLGILVDHIGIKKTVSMGLLLTILGGFVMWGAESIWMLQLSRILLGVGSGTAFLCAVKYVSDHFTTGNRGMLMGGTITLGLIGAIFAGSILILLIQTLGWRETVLYCSLFGFTVLSLILIFVKDIRRSSDSENQLHSFSFPDTLVRIKAILKNPLILLYALLAIGVYTPESVLADLWGTGFLMQKHELSQAEAAFASTSMYLGMGIGSIFLPWLCEKFDFLNKGIQICTLCIFFGFAFILFSPMLSHPFLVGCFIIIGFFSGAEMMCFTGAVLYTTPKNSGLTIGIVNTLNMFIGAILQQGIGSLLDIRWKGEMTESGIRLYTAHDYIWALSSLLGVIGVCCILSLFLQKRPQFELSSR